MLPRFPLARVAAATVALVATLAHAGAPPLTIRFNNTSGLPDAQVYVGFVGGQLSAINADTGQPLARSTFESPNWYTLAQLDTVRLTGFSGRLYVGYGTPWTFANPGYEPSATNPSDPNYRKRYDKMELTYFGNPADVANATTIDYFSIPINLRVRQAGVLRGAINANTTATTLNAVRNLTTPPDAAVVRDANNNFVRAIGPSVYPPTGGLPASPYPNFADYLTYLRDVYAPAHDGTVARIKGYFGGVGPNPTTPQTTGQNYDFRVTINAARDLILTGSGTQVGPHTVVYKYADLVSPTGIYGANPTFLLDGQLVGSGNDLYGWMSGDLLAALNIGAVGSTVLRNGVEVGTLDSSQWFALTDLFASLQPANPFYNTWAAALDPLSDAYNFAYSDRFAPVTVTLNPSTVDTLELDLGGPDAVPEPAAGAAVVAAGVVALRRRR